MELATATTGGDFKPAPEGMHRAICYRFVDLGTQETDYKGEIKRQRKILLGFELADAIEEFEFDGRQERRPFSVQARFTWSMHEKGNLRPFLESWRGKRFKDEDLAAGGFDAKRLVGVPAYLNVLHNEAGGKTYANISSINPLPAAMKADLPQPHNPLVYLALQGDRFEQTVFDGLTERLRATIAASPEYKALHGEDHQQSKPVEDFSSDTLDDDIPF